MFHVPDAALFQKFVQENTVKNNVTSFDTSDYLPHGVTYSPEAIERLIARDAAAILRINTHQHPPNAAYQINERKGDFIAHSYQRGDFYQNLVRTLTDTLHPLTGGDAIYCGAEHVGQPKLPNITVVPNVRVGQPGQGQLNVKSPYLMGCTMGHWHSEPQRDQSVQEVYEFLSYGLLVIDQPAGAESSGSEGSVVIWVAKPGDKVTVPHQCHMTLYNLNGGQQPLVTLDFANPERNRSNKHLIDEIGPIMQIACRPKEQDWLISFVLNREYMGRGRPTADNRQEGHDNYLSLHTGLGGGRALSKWLESKPSGLHATIPLKLSRRLNGQALGKELHRCLLTDKVKEQFEQFGIKVRATDPEVRTNGIWVRRPLFQATRPDTPWSQYFLGTPRRMDLSSDCVPSPLHEREGEVSGRSTLDVHADPDMEMRFFVEGAGDWTDGTFVPALSNLLNGHGVKRASVSIIDKSEYRTKVADSPHPDLPPHVYKHIDQFLRHNRSSSYFDKSHAGDVIRYRSVSPSIVFVATPDRTHAATCIEHIERDRRPTAIFVEKPFEYSLDETKKLIATYNRLIWQQGAFWLHQELQKPSEERFAHEGNNLRTHAGELDTLYNWFDEGPTPTQSTPEWSVQLRDFVRDHALYEVERTVLEAGRLEMPGIYALDHYRYYVWQMMQPTPTDDSTLLAQATEWLGGRVVRADFALAEEDPIIKQEDDESGRTRAQSLDRGMIYDLAPHALAMLAYFTDISTVDDISILKLGRYKNPLFKEQPFDIKEETCAELSFTVQDYSDCGHPVFCHVWLGKGLMRERKFLWVEGVSKRSILFALSKKTTNWCNSVYGDQEVSQHGVYFLDADGRVGPSQLKLPLDRDRYNQFMIDLWRGTKKAVTCAMPMEMGYQIVSILSRMENAKNQLKKEEKEAEEILKSYELGHWDWRMG